MTDKKKTIGSGKKVGALVSGLNVLRYMVKCPVPVGVSQVARDVGISPSTCFNILRTLVLEGLLDFDSEAKTYSINYGLLELTEGLSKSDRLIQFLKPQLSQIALAHRITATLWRRSGEDRAVLVDRTYADSAVRIHMPIGQRLPIFIGAMGRCAASTSGLSKEAIRQKFTSLRWENPPEFEEFWDDVGRAHTLGYAIDRDHFVRGVTSVAAPILFDSSGQLTLIASAVGFSGQFSEATLDALAKELLEVRDSSR